MEILRALTLAALLPLTAFAKEAPLSAADYDASELRGWPLHVEKSLKDHPRRQEALTLLDRKLAEIETLVPASQLPSLKQVPLWLSRNASPGACYHPSADWLQKNGRVVEMARSIEFQNIDHFVDWSRDQPLMVLHELAHALHDRTLPQGYGNPEIAGAYKRALDSGKYEKVRRANGKEERHYAMQNPMEYFAECSEAYFGKNDYYPFTRTELKAFDPDGYALIEKLWKITPP